MMAGIDKIYVYSYKEFCELYSWCATWNEECMRDTSKSLLDYFYYTPEEVKEYYGDQGYYPMGIPATNTPFIIDEWLYLHCPIIVVRDRITNWYRSPRMDKRILLYLDKG